MDWELLWNIATVVFTAATIIGGALLGLLYTTTKTLRASNEDLRLRVEDIEKERARDKVRIAERDAKIAEREAVIAEREGENALLKSVVTGKVEWLAISDQLEEHHRQTLGYWKKADERFAEMIAAIRGQS